MTTVPPTEAQNQRRMNTKQSSHAVSTSKSVTTITPQDDARDALEHLLSRVQQVFALLHYRMLVHDKNPEADAGALIVLKNAALESSLMSIRDLDLFFSKGQWNDDIIASLYGFVPKHRLLDDMERNSINKKLAHLTCHAGRELRMDPTKRNPRTWKYADLVERTMKPVLEFMDHLISSRFTMDANQRDLLDTTRSAVLVNLRKLTALSKKELNGVKV